MLFFFLPRYQIIFCLPRGQITNGKRKKKKITAGYLPLVITVPFFLSLIVFFLLLLKRYCFKYAQRLRLMFTEFTLTIYASIYKQTAHPWAINAIETSTWQKRIHSIAHPRPTKQISPKLKPTQFFSLSLIQCLRPIRYDCAFDNRLRAHCWF